MCILDLVFVGCPSLDRIRSAGQLRSVLGGAAFISAVAARRAGARVGLVARVPTPLPEQLGPAFGTHGLDPGGLVADSGPLPGFVIDYDAEERASYSSTMELGVEARVCAADFPEAWLEVPLVHVSPLAGSTRKQLDFVAGLRARGFRGRFSAGTFLRAVHGEPELVRQLVERVDLFFCNREEAEIVWPEGAPSHPGTVCVSDGPRAVELHRAGRVVRRPVPLAEVDDPTGAGDALCGGFLAGLVLGVDPVCRGLSQARAVLRGPGAVPLIERLARVDDERLALVAAALRAHASASALDFCGFPFPERDDPLAADWAAAATLHQYGFWEADEAHWLGSMWATAGGRRFKGSDFVWQGFTRARRADPTVLDPARMVAEPGLLPAMLADDDGRCPLPDLDSHVALHQAYGAALPPGGFGEILAEANAAERPGRTLLERLTTLPGYAEDPLQKKALLLVLILARRPEGLLDLRDPESLGPIVDYHMMRGCLRTGCVRVLDPDLERRLAERRWVDARQEDEVREASWHALRALCEVSGLTVAEVDGFFFANGRKTCVEVGEVTCAACAIRDRCAQRADLFQPVFRTTAY